MALRLQPNGHPLHGLKRLSPIIALCAVAVAVAACSEAPEAETGIPHERPESLLGSTVATVRSYGHETVTVVDYSKPVFDLEPTYGEPATDSDFVVIAVCSDRAFLDESQVVDVAVLPYSEISPSMMTGIQNGELSSLHTCDLPYGTN